MLNARLPIVAFKVKSQKLQQNDKVRKKQPTQSSWMSEGALSGRVLKALQQRDPRELSSCRCAGLPRKPDIQLYRLWAFPVLWPQLKSSCLRKPWAVGNQADANLSDLAQSSNIKPAKRFFVLFWTYRADYSQNGDIFWMFLALKLWAVFGRRTVRPYWGNLLADIWAVNMNSRLTLQHGIGLQQLLLDLIHLLALPTHRRHVWHHQLTGLCSRAASHVSVQSPCAWATTVTVIASYNYHRNEFGGWMYPRHDSEKMDVLGLVMLALADCCTWGMFSKISIQIRNGLRRGTPCRRTAGIGIISALQHDEWPRTKEGGGGGRKEADTACWMTRGYSHA